jgi:hypothetical protein
MLVAQRGLLVLARMAGAGRRDGPFRALPSSIYAATCADAWI